MLYRFSFHIPLSYNDGRRIEPEIISHILDEIAHTFGAWTKTSHLGFPMYEGLYQEPGKTPSLDQHTIITADGPPEKLEEVRHLKGVWEPALLQRHLYVTYQPIEVVETLPPPTNFDSRVDASLESFKDTYRKMYDAEPSQERLETKRGELREFFRKSGLYPEQPKQADE